MSESQPKPERDGDAPDPSSAEPSSGASEQDPQDQAAVPDEPQGGENGAPQPSAPPASAERALTDAWPVRALRLARGRTGLWAAVAALCVAAGIAGSILGAHAVAHTDGAKARRAFQRTSTTIAAALKLAVRHEEQLGVSASTFLADHPHATAAEFATWTRWARTVRRYPELDALGFLALPPAVPALPHASPALSHASPALPHASPALLLSRDTATSVYTPLSAGGRRALAVEIPVYRGDVTPRSVFGRRAAAVGWLREVLVPGVVLHEILAGQPGYALRLRYRGGAANVAFTEGAPRAGAQTTTIRLRGGWSVKSFGPAVDPGVSADANARALLIGGVLLSVLLGVLVFMLGSRLPRTRPPRAEAPAPAPAPPEPADADLYDTLTGLPNRSLTLDRAERMVARATRDSGMLAGALFVDIDRLKDVNEKLGAAAGDQLLRIVGERLHGVVRTHDTVGRLGGDEFVVLVESAARGIRLDSLAQRMIAALHQPVELDDFGPSFVLTASIGVAFGRYETYEDMLRDARLALASAKAAGKDRYTLFNANMRTVIEGRAVLEAELNTALSEQQFFLLYQPIYDLGTQRVAEVEALIRWRHPTQGVLAPEDFVPLAEETGLIVPIGRWALEEACNRAAAWQVAGHRVGVAVKISAAQLDRQGFVTDVRRALQQSGIEPSLLTLEIAETAVMRDLESSAARLRELKSLGVSVAIDDFGGSGYAYHSDLRGLSLDCLRVDRSSLAASDDEDYRSWLLGAILLVGRDLSLRVIATGIETAEQMASVQAAGCTMAQGFLLGKPTPVDALEGLFLAGFPAAHAISTDPAFSTGPAFTVPAQSAPPASQPSDPQPRG